VSKDLGESSLMMVVSMLLGRIDASDVDDDVKGRN
jgi:hypothetical protein